MGWVPPPTGLSLRSQVYNLPASAEMNGKVLIQSGRSVKWIFPLWVMCWLVRCERDEIRRVKNKTFLGHKIWYRDICYIGCAEKPLMLWREDSGPTYPLWLRQNKVSVRTPREIPQEKDFPWKVYWAWLTKNAKAIPDLRSLRRPCSSVPTFSQLTQIQHLITLQSQKGQQTMQSSGFGFHSSLLNMWSSFVGAMQVHQSTTEQPRHHVLTCSGSLYKLQYFHTVRSNMPSQSWFLLLLPESKLAVVIFTTTLSQSVSW